MDGEVEDGKAELLACSVSSGEAWNGGVRQRLELGYRRASRKDERGRGREWGCAVAREEVEGVLVACSSGRGR
jgi:hypothetical protein